MNWGTLGVTTWGLLWVERRYSEHLPVNEASAVQGWLIGASPSTPETQF